MYKKALSMPPTSPADLIHPAIEERDSRLLKDVTPEEALLFACTRQYFLDRHQKTVLDICRRHQIKWNFIYETATLHGVAPLIYANLLQCLPEDLGVPPEIMGYLRQSLMHNMLVKEKLARSLLRTLSFFEKKSIKVMLTKGAGLDITVYDQPYYTVLADIDLVLNIRREEIAADTSQAYMDFFHQSGIEYDYFEHHDIIMNGVLPINFQKIWDDAAKIKFRGYDLFVMSPEDMLISVCINSCRKRFFRLKSLCDIAETIGKYPDLDWDKLVLRAKEFDCHNIVYTALLVTKMTLGCDLPGEVLEKLGVGPVRAKIIHLLGSRMSLSAFSSLYSGISVLDRRLDWSLILPYATFRWYQIWRRIRFVLHSEDRVNRVNFKQSCQ